MGCGIQGLGFGNPKPEVLGASGFRGLRLLVL